MNALTWERLHPLLNHHEPPCTSVYMPTHRQRPDNQQDPIRFKNLVREAEHALKQKYPSRGADSLLKPLYTLVEDDLFWTRNWDGLAVLAAPGVFEIHRLQHPLKELAVVADSFHVKPLLRYVQSADRYQVLCLTREDAKLYHGNRYALDPAEMGDFPATITAALGEEITELQRNVASYGKGPGGNVMVHGHGTQKDDIANDTERFFRVIDREVLARLSRPSKLPLVLVALPEHQPIFRGLSQNPHLLPGGVAVNPGALTPEQLRQEVWKAVEPQYLARLKKYCEDFHTAQKREKASSDLSDVARAAIAGRVGLLLVEADRLIPGRLDSMTGAIKETRPGEPEADDLLDDLAEQVLRRDGQVVIVPTERMPAKTGLAAIYRY